MGVLAALQEDAVAELFNLGMGTAAASLSEMVGSEVGLSVPKVEYVPRAQAGHHLRDGYGDRVAGISEAFSGAFTGCAMLIFPETRSLNLVRAIMADSIPLDGLTDLEEEVLTEIGNIIVNACLGTLADVLNEEITSDLPRYLKSDTEKIFHQTGRPTPGETVMFVRIEFTVADQDIMGMLVLALDLASIRTLGEKIEKCMLGTCRI